MQVLPIPEKKGTMFEYAKRSGDAEAPQVVVSSRHGKRKRIGGKQDKAILEWERE